MNPLDLVGLTHLMERGSGHPDFAVGLIDGPVAVSHPDLATTKIREVLGGPVGQCVRRESLACEHGTFVAGILFGRRQSAAPAICPGCTLLVRPVFPETNRGDGQMPQATPQILATAIVDCIKAGARAINLSLALTQSSSRGDRELNEALDLAMRRGVIVVAAAGNQGAVGSTTITRHPWVIPVAACDLYGRPARGSNLGHSIGRQGLSAPGDGIISISTSSQPLRSGGTSVAAPFVTGAIALLWSEFPSASAAQLKRAVTQRRGARRPTVVPALLDAWAAFQVLAGSLS
jgi:subtilisin family serine protease